MDLSFKGLLVQVAGFAMRMLVAIGVASLTWAVVNERRMQKHRKPGVTYGQATLRKDGGWRRSELFTDEGLAYQRRAAKWGFLGIVSLLVAVLLALIAR